MIGRRHKKRHHRNPGGAMTLRRPMQAIAAGFKPASIVEILPMAAGAFLNYGARTAIGRKFPVTATGIPSYAVGLGGAGLMLLIPKYGPKLFAGAIVEEILRAVTQYVAPGVRMLGEYLLTSNKPSAMSEFLEDNTKRAVGEINLRDYLEVDQPQNTAELNMRV